MYPLEDLSKYSELEKGLILSSYYGNIEEIERFLCKGANLHVDYDLPLRIASENGLLEVVKYLVDKGAKIHAVNDAALRYTENPDIISFLISKMDPNYVLENLSEDFEAYFRQV